MIRAMPVLQVLNVTTSEAFYCDKLGFRSRGRGDGPEFCIVQRGGVTIALDLSRDGSSPPVNQYWAAYLYVEDADALAQEFRERGVHILRGPEDTDYGSRDFDVRDPDGHIIAFGADLDPRPVLRSPGNRLAMPQVTTPASPRVLLPVARKMREILESYSASAVEVAFEAFPIGACGATSELLARYLREFVQVDALYASGGLYASGEHGRASHAWVVADGWIVDITADQFGQPPVIVTQDEAWHRDWEDGGSAKAPHHDTGGGTAVPIWGLVRDCPRDGRWKDHRWGRRSERFEVTPVEDRSR